MPWLVSPMRLWLVSPPWYLQPVDPTALLAGLEPVLKVRLTHLSCGGCILALTLAHAVQGEGCTLTAVPDAPVGMSGGGSSPRLCAYGRDSAPPCWSHLFCHAAGNLPAITLCVDRTHLVRCHPPCLSARRYVCTRWQMVTLS